MTAPYVPKFEADYTPTGSQYLKIRHPATTGAWKQYDVPTAGVKCHTELLGNAAAYFASQFGGTWTWVIDHASQHAKLTWDTGQPIDFQRTLELGAYLGLASDLTGETSPMWSAVDPQGICYPSRPLESEQVMVIGRHQYAWHKTDQAATVAGPRRRINYTLGVLVDNTADDWAEYAQLWDFVINYIADNRGFCWFQDYDDPVYLAAYLGLLPEQQDLTYERIEHGSRRFFRVTLECARNLVGKI